MGARLVTNNLRGAPTPERTIEGGWQRMLSDWWQDKGPMMEELVHSNKNSIFIKSLLVCLSKGDDFKLMGRARNRNWLTGKKPGVQAAGQTMFRLHRSIFRRKGRDWERLSQPLK